VASSGVDSQWALRPGLKKAGEFWPLATGGSVSAVRKGASGEENFFYERDSAARYLCLKEIKTDMYSRKIPNILCPGLNMCSPPTDPQLISCPFVH